MSDLSQKKKLVWLGLKRPQADLSEIAFGVDKLKAEVGDYDTFQSDLDNVSNYTEFETYLENNGFTNQEANNLIDRTKNNFNSYSDFKDYVQNQTDSYAELKNGYDSNKTIGSEEETNDGQQLAGVKFYESDGVTRDGVSVPAGSVEVFGKEVHFSQTTGSTGSSASFSFSNLSVSNTNPNRGESVDISATVTNNGGVDGTAYAGLTEDGSVVDSKGVIVDANSSKTVTFTRTYNEYQQVDVSIQNLSPITITVAPDSL